MLLQAIVLLSVSLVSSLEISRWLNVHASDGELGEFGNDHSLPAEKPWFCHKLECPTYTVTGNGTNYEVRKYPAFKWTTTTTEGLDYKHASSQNFMRLFRYISGANDKKVKIPMTAPVLVSVQVTQGPFCANNFTMHFFIPFESQENPPTPTENTVGLVTLEEQEVYVRSYGGFSSIEKLQKNAQKLAVDLEKDGLGASYDATMLYSAGYDSPFHLLNRHNEVWFIKKKD